MNFFLEAMMSCLKQPTAYYETFLATYPGKCMQFSILVIAVLHHVVAVMASEKMSPESKNSILEYTTGKHSFQETSLSEDIPFRTHP